MKELDPKELVPWGWAPGNYIITCKDCGRGGPDWLMGDKRSWRCERCAMIARYTQAEKLIQEKSYLWL